MVFYFRGTVGVGAGNCKARKGADEAAVCALWAYGPAKMFGFAKH
jgi:hypothetical protein